VKRFRALAIIAATAAIVAIPGAAQAGRQDNCVTETVDMFKSTFSMASPGEVADLIAGARANAHPWCE
jgi:hypothetical protein